MRYPDAPVGEDSDPIGEVVVRDPYRWLEDPASAAVQAWSAAEAELAAPWLAARPGRDALAARLTELVPGVRSAPLVVGERRFHTVRAPGQDHAVIVVSEVGGPERVLVDPNALDPAGTTTLDSWSPSVEGDLLAYQLSSGGDEESRLRVMDVATGGIVDGPIDRVRYSPVAWLPGGEELFYVRRLPPDAVPEGEANYHRRVWRHRVGEDPAGDRLVFGDGGPMTAYYGVGTSDDGRFLVVSRSLGTAPRDDVWVAALDQEGAGAGPAWREVLVGVDAQVWPELDCRGRLWLLTDLDAPRRRLCVVDAAAPDPGPAAWEEVVAAEDGAVLEDAVRAGDALVLVRSRHAVTEIEVVDAATRAPRCAVTLPGPGTADVTGRRDEGPEVWVGFTDATAPYRVGQLDLVTGDVAWPVGTGEGRVATSRLVTYRSADGTEVRMTIVSSDGAAEADGRPVQAASPRPTVLYGYGGFGVSLSPAYSSTVLAWVEAGGVWATAHLRGGSEEGEAWHRAGMRQDKERVFEDFEAAGEWLVAEGWTTTDQLGIMGGSNGGLLVGAAVTRRPDLWRAAVCSAPLLDMLRYERFGLGATWSDEFGRIADPEEARWLLAYSPYHHVVPEVEYPAVLFTTFDSDTRVDPLHARKMAAALQAATTAPPDKRPVLLRAEPDVGHGARSVARSVALAADELAFLADQLGLSLPAAPAGTAPAPSPPT
jgi:prolyl oligopeptidase